MRPGNQYLLTPLTRKEAIMGLLIHINTVGLIVAGLSFAAHAAKLEEVAPFPKADSGFTRQVIHLAPQTQEDGYQVEILAGKTLAVDCNRQRLGGILEEKNLEGWGYPFYRLEKVIGPMSTLMACPDGKSTKDFVPVVGDGFMLRYNSKLPIVLYVPKDIEVRYRIWSASSKVEKAVQE
jgi:ecotin